MRPYIPAIVVLLILTVLVGAGLVTAKMLQSPQAIAREEVAPEIEKAKRMLAQYEGGQPLLVASLQRLSEAKLEPSSRPAAAEPSTESADVAEAGAPPISGQRDYLAEGKEELDRREQELQGRLATLGGEPYVAPEFNSSEELRRQIEANAALLDKALQAVRSAANSSGGQALGSESQVVAARLESRILYLQADLKRRQAAVWQARADAERNAFSKVLLAWQGANNQVQTLQTELNGVAGGTISQEAPAPTAQPAAPAAPAPAAVKPAAPPAATPAGGEPAGGKSSLLGKLKGLLGGKSKTAEPAEPQPEPGPGTAPASDNTIEQPAAAPQPAAEASPPAAVLITPVPPIEERVQQLQAQGRETDTQIADAQKDVDRLSAVVVDLQTKLEKARNDASAAEKRMMDLEDAGIKGLDQKALNRFTNEYDQAAKANREASREASNLENGTMRNAQADAQEENEVLTAPLVPVKPDQKIQPEPGLTNLQAELQAAQALVESRQQLRKLIDAQVKALESRRDELNADLAKAQAWRTSLTEEAIQVAKKAAAAAREAQKLESEAVKLLEGEGQQAAQRAVQAANERARQIAEFYQQNAAPAPQTGYMAGHAEAVVGDVEFERAQILAQKSDCLRHQDHLMARLAQMGIDPAKVSAATPAGEEPAGAPATQPAAGTPTAQPAALAEAADAAQKEALAAADAALKHYEKASGDLGRLWTVQAEVAAVHYLMASLKSGAEAQKERTTALREYQLATRDRGDLARAYRPVIESLSPQQ